MTNPRVDQADLDGQFSPSRLVQSLDAYLAEYAARSAEARRLPGVRTGLRYGAHPDEVLDLWPGPVPGAPVQVFVHGGNWQALSKDDAGFPAPQFRAAGAAFVAVNYGLAPGASLDELVARVRRCVGWLHANAAELGLDPARLHLSGHSAGAHLAAMAMLPTAQRPDPASLIAGVTLLSGMYDLEPVRRSYVNQALGLDAEAAERNSPAFHLSGRLPPVVIARGAGETAEYARQHAVMADALRTRTSLVELVDAGRNHFDLPFDLGAPETPLGRAVLTQMSLGDGAPARSAS